MRNYLSSRAFDRVSVGGDDTGNNIAGVLNVSDGGTVDCLKYAGYVINIGEGETGTVDVRFDNLQPGAVFHLFMAGGTPCLITVPSGANIVTSAGAAQSFNLSGLNNQASTFIIVSKTIASLVGF